MTAVAAAAREAAQGPSMPAVPRVRNGNGPLPPKAPDSTWEMPPRIVDLHVWRVGREKFAVILSLAAEDVAVTPETVKRVLGQHQELAHISVEVNRHASRS